MNIPLKYFVVTLLFAAATFGVLPLDSFAVEEDVSNGYVCEPKNPGGEETRLYFRQQDGVAINLASDATFPVVCPVVFTYDEPPHKTSIVFRNGSNATQKFSCALEEYDVFSNKVRSTGRAVDIPADGSDFILYENIFLSDDTNYLSLRCIIPPRGMIGRIDWL